MEGAMMHNRMGGCLRHPEQRLLLLLHAASRGRAGRELALETASQEFRLAIVRTHSGTDNEKSPEMSETNSRKRSRRKKRSESHYMNSVPKKKAHKIFPRNNNRYPKKVIVRPAVSGPIPCPNLARRILKQNLWLIPRSALREKDGSEETRGVSRTRSPLPFATPHRP